MEKFTIFSGYLMAMQRLLLRRSFCFSLPNFMRFQLYCPNDFYWCIFPLHNFRHAWDSKKAMAICSTSPQHNRCFSTLFSSFWLLHRQKYISKYDKSIWMLTIIAYFILLISWLKMFVQLSQFVLLWLTPLQIVNSAS